MWHVDALALHPALLAVGAFGGLAFAANGNDIRRAEIGSVVVGFFTGLSPCACGRLLGLDCRHGGDK